MGDKGDRCVGLTTLPPSCADCLDIWEPQPPGALRVCPGMALPLNTFLWTFSITNFIKIGRKNRRSFIYGPKYSTTFTVQLFTKRPMARQALRPDLLYQISTKSAKKYETYQHKFTKPLNLNYGRRRAACDDTHSSRIPASNLMSFRQTVQSAT